MSNSYSPQPTYEETLAKVRHMTNEQLASINTVWGEDEARAINEEKERRRQEYRRKHQERIERYKRNKEAVEYSDVIATEICERISAGELLTATLLDEHLPTIRRCNQWLKEHGEFAALYASALNDRLSIFEEDIVRIPDEAARDFDEVKSKGSVRRVLDPAKITAAKLRVEVRRLHLKAGKPQKWGDSTTLITKNADEFDPSNMSADELERQIADIENKSRVGRAA
jgi:hypothetical protein